MVIKGPYRHKDLPTYCKLYSKPRLKPIVDYRVKKILERKFNITGPETPQSIYQPEALYSSIADFGKQSSFTFDKYFERAISSAYSVFGRSSVHGFLKPDPSSKFRVHMDKSAGIYFMSKEEAFNLADSHAFKVIMGKNVPKPCLAFARTQRGKTRLVWGYPLDMTILESQFSQVLTAMFKERRSPISFALRRIELGARIQGLCRSKWKVGLDFNRFDSTVPASLIRVAFRILRTWFDFSDQSIVYTREWFEKSWKQVVNYFIATPIVMPDGNLYIGKQRGIPSGSDFTQLIGSIVNYIIVKAVSYRFNFYIPKHSILVLGDDSLFGTNQPVNLSFIGDYLTSKGFVLNLEKSEITKGDEVKYLGITWKRGVPFFEDFKIYRSGVYPERFRLYPRDKFRAEVLAYKAIILPIMSIGQNGAIHLAMKQHPLGPAAIYSENVGWEFTQHLPGYLRFQVSHGGAKNSGLWNPGLFPYSS